MKSEYFIIFVLVSFFTGLLVIFNGNLILAILSILLFFIVFLIKEKLEEKNSINKRIRKCKRELKS